MNHYPLFAKYFDREIFSNRKNRRPESLATRNPDAGRAKASTALPATWKIISRAGGNHRDMDAPERDEILRARNGDVIEATLVDEQRFGARN